MASSPIQKMASILGGVVDITFMGMTMVFGFTMVYETYDRDKMGVEWVR